jgi:type I restriction enzyme S subunit
MSELPSGWVWGCTEDVASVQGGIQKQPKRRPVRNHYPFLRVANVLRGRLDLSEVHEVELFDGELARLRLEPDDLLVVEGNGSPDQIGRAARWSGEIQDCVHQNHLIRVRPAAAVDAKYLAYYWNAPSTAEYLRSVASSTSGLYVLTAAKVRGVRVPLPPVAEQQRIVAAIEKQFSRIDVGAAALERARRNLARMRAGILHAAVTGELVGVTATRWRRVPLGELITAIQAGKSFKCEERPAGPDEWGVIKVSAMTWGHFQESENKTVLPTRKIDKRLEIRPGDLLVSRANTVDYVGAVVLVQNCRSRLLLSDKSLRLVPTGEALPEWLIIALRSRDARRYIERVATGTSDSMRNISQPKLKALEVALPPVELQHELIREVDRRLSVVEQTESDIERQFQQIDRLRAAILADAFAGRLVPQVADDEPTGARREPLIRERMATDGHRAPSDPSPKTRVPA